MCKGGSRTTESTQNTTQNTNQNTSQNGWNSGSDEAMDWARKALGMADALPWNAPPPSRTMANPYTNLNLGHAYEDAASAGQAVRPFLARGDAANLNAGYALDSAGNTINEAAGYFRQGGQRDVNLNPLDVQKYFNPYSAYAFQNLNQNLGIEGAKLKSANAAAMGGIGGDRAAVSEALKFGQDQLARGNLSASLWDRATGVASEQQGREYTADSANRENLYKAGTGLTNIAANQQNLAGNWMNNANTWFNQYNAGQNRAMGAATAQYNLEQGRRDIDFQNAQTAYQQPYQNANYYANLIRGLIPTLGTQSGSTGQSQGTMTGTTTGTQTQTTQQDPLSLISGLAMTGIGLATGNPTMAMKGMGGSMGGGMGGKGSGGGTGYATNPWSTGGSFGPGGSGWWGSGEYTGPLGGTNMAYSRARGGRIPRKAEGGEIWYPESIRPAPDPIPDSPWSPRNFNERALPHIEAARSGEYDQEGANINDFTGTPAMEASHAGVIPLPRERPEEAGPRDLPLPRSMDVASSRANPYAPSAPRPLDTGADDYDIKLPEEPKYLSYKRPERNWSEFLLRAGLATLAARGDTDSGGVPKGSFSNIGKGALNALDHEDKDKEHARKEIETENYNLSLSDSAKRWREQARVTRQNAVDTNAEREAARKALEQHRADTLERQRAADAERARHNAAEEARKSFITQNRNDMLKMGKPYSDDAIVYKAQVRADNWRKDKQRLMESGVIKRGSLDLDEGWQKVYNETRKAMLEAREEAFSRMRNPAAATP